MSFFLAEDDEIKYESESFPYPKQVTRSSFLQDLQIDDTNPSQSLSKLQSHQFDVDKFLFQNYRYTLLDDLQKELNDLLSDLDKELFDLVNDDYYEFIKLGKALDGGEGLIDTLRVDVSKYRKKLLDEDQRLTNSKEYVQRTVNDLDMLAELKKHAQQMLLLDTLIIKFETLLNRTNSTTYIEILKQLTSLYLSIHQLLTTIPPTYQFVINKSDHVAMLRHEFEAVIDEFLRNSIRNADNGDKFDKNIIDILSIYSIVGGQDRAVAIIKETFASIENNIKNSKESEVLI